MYGALRQEGENDYVLEEEQMSCWITVNNISVYVRRTDEGVIVDLYPLGHESHDSIIGTWALFSEAEEYIENELGSGDDGRGEGEDRSEPRPETQAGDPQ